MKSRVLGIEYWEPYWSGEHVLDRIHEYARRGFPVNGRWVYENDRGLVNAAYIYFGSWEAALYAVGLDAEAIGPKFTKLERYPGRKEVIEGILQRAAKGAPLSVTAAYAGNAGLVLGARRYFAGWDAALIAAGIDAIAIKKKAYAARRRRPIAYPDPQSVKVEILRREAAGMPLHFHRVQYSDFGLAYGGKKHFGSWDNALTAAGLNPATIRNEAKKAAARKRTARLQADDRPLRCLRPSKRSGASGRQRKSAERAHGRPLLTKEHVITRLRLRHELGKPLNYSRVAEDELQLVNAARRRFGSYRSALEAARISPNQAYTRNVYDQGSQQELLTAARTVAQLRGTARHRAAKLLHEKYNGMVQNSRMFGNWTRVAELAGVAPERLGENRFSTKDLLNEEVAEWLSSGKSWTGGRVFKEDRALYAAICRHFGSFQGFTRVATD